MFDLNITIEDLTSLEEEEEICHTCEGGGWVQVYHPNPPAFAECPECGNPHGYLSP